MMPRFKRALYHLYHIPPGPIEQVEPELLGEGDRQSMSTNVEAKGKHPVPSWHHTHCRHLPSP